MSNATFRVCINGRRALECRAHRTPLCTFGGRRLRQPAAREHTFSSIPSAGRKHCACRAKSEPYDAFKDDPGMEAALDKSIAVIGGILDDVCGKMMAENAAAFVTAASDTRESLPSTVRAAVAARLDELDQMTLMTLDSMIQVQRRDGDAGMLDLLVAIRREVVDQVRTTLPDEIQLLDTLTQARDDSERKALMAGRTRDELAAVGMAASQVIGDIEEAEAIADVRLLCRLVLVREAVYSMIASIGGGNDREARPRRAGVPRSVAAFVKELMAMGDGLEREAVLYSKLKEACKTPVTTTEGSQAVLELTRPGVLMQTLHVLRAEMKEGPQAMEATDPRAVIARMDAIWDEAAVVIDKLGRE